MISDSIIHQSNLLYQAKLITMYGGNISVRENNSFWITPSQLPKNVLKDDLIIQLDLNSLTIKNSDTLGQFQGEKPIPSIEKVLHQLVYQNTDAKAIIHTHPMNAVLYSFQPFPIPSFSYEASLVAKNLTMAVYKPEGTLELAEEVKNAALKSKIIIMENHGVVTYGNDLHEASYLVEALDRTLNILFKAKQLGLAPTIPNEFLEP